MALERPNLVNGISVCGPGTTKPFCLYFLELKLRIPKGFRRKAQGCACRGGAQRRREARATLGRRGKMFFNPERVGPVPGCICIASAKVAGRGHNPFGVADPACRFSQGSSCLATLGWRTQSRWDWKRLHVAGAGVIASGAGADGTADSGEGDSGGSGVSPAGEGTAGSGLEGKEPSAAVSASGATTVPSDAAPSGGTSDEGADSGAGAGGVGLGALGGLMIGFLAVSSTPLANSITWP